MPFTKSDRGGYPKILSDFRPFLTGDSLDAKRAVLTILQLYKLVESKGEPNLNGITTPYAGKECPEWLPEYVRQLEIQFPVSEVEERIKQLKPSYHISGKNGPNGPSLGSAHADRVAIRGTDIERAVLDLATETGFDSLMMVLSADNVDFNLKSSKGKVPAHSRLRIKYETGGKARVFAIADFYSQSALKSIHDYFMNWLKLQKEDGTDDHADAADAVKEWSKGPDPLYSCDLTEATNRWPFFLLRLVVQAAFGHSIADAWERVFTTRDFRSPDDSKDVHFAVGLPLGMLSAWAVFAVSHHSLVRMSGYLAWKKGLPRQGSRSFKPFRDYRIIGDDITIKGAESIVNQYRSCLSDLAVDVSATKSVLPSQVLDGTPTGELAKRLFKGGNELTPLPPDAILLGMEPYGTRTLLETAYRRGYLSAGSPYLVQSTRLSQAEWAELTFPFRNRLPQLNGVKKIYEVRRDLDLAPPGSLDPKWFQWFDKPEEEIDGLVRRFLVSEVRSAEERVTELLSSLLYETYGLEVERYGFDNPIPKGGDWQPGLLQTDPELLRNTITQAQDTLYSALDELYNPGFTNLDLYKFIGRLQVYLDPELMVKGRMSQDQKTWTRHYMSNIVKYCHKMSNA